MKSKRLYKVVRLLMIVSLVVQALLPALAIAETIDKEEKNGRTTLNKAQWEDEKNLQTVIVEGKVEKGTAEDNQPETIVLKGADFENVTTEENISGLTEGSYKLEDNKVLLNLTEQSEGNFSLKLYVVKDSLVNGKEIEVTLGDQVLTLPIKLEETDKEKPTDDEKTSDKEAETKPEKETKPEQESSTSKKQVGNIADKERGLPFAMTELLPNAAGLPWDIAKDSKVSDPDTDSLADMGFSDVPGAHDGRIWTDKTVRHDLGSLDDDQFEVTLSALAQSAPIRAGYQIPADTVFTIDVSGSMTRVDPGAGRSRIALLVDALNEAIGILQDANPLNRVAVVAYGGRTGGFARVENVFALGRYNPNSNGAFFTMTGNSQVNVVATAVTGSGGQVKVNNFVSQGSTPTQWGIREASLILENVTDQQVEVPVTNDAGEEENPVRVTRRPNLILMTDGEPTMGRPDFDFDALTPVTVGPNGNQLVASDGDFYGDGSYGEQGLAVMTALTAAYRGKTVLNHYFPNGNVAGDAPTQPAADIGFFSISLGKQDTEAGQNLISATLNPTPENTDKVGPNVRHQMGLTGTSAGPTAATPTLTTLFNNFATNGATGNFQAQFRQAFGTYQWNNTKSTVNIRNNASVELSTTDIAYADEFFKADDLQTLRDAFISITNSIQDTGNSEILGGNGNGTNLGAGTLDFSDVLGKYMSFDGLTNIEFPARNGGTFTYNISEVDAHREDFIKTLTQQIRLPDGNFIDAATAGAILDNRPDNVITYFTNDQGRYIGLTADGAATKAQVYPVWGEIENQVDSAVNNVSGLLFTVHTALIDHTFTSDYGSAEHKSGYRELQAKDQFVHWSIPAHLIPERTVQQNEDGTVSITGNTSPIQARFNVGLDEARVEEALLAGEALPTNFFSNYWDNDANSSFATFESSTENPFYNFDGARIVGKTANPTNTKAHVSRQLVEADPTAPAGQDGRIVTNLLGNNGTFALDYYGQIRLEKEFIFLDENGNRVNSDGAIPAGVTLRPLTFTITGPNNFEETVTFDPDKFTLENGKWHFDLPEYLPAGVYTIKEAGGDVEQADPGYTHMPGEFDQTVTVIPGGVATASFVNVYVQPQLNTPSLRIMKFFHGLPADTYPEDFEILIEYLGDGNPQPGNGDVWTLNTTTGYYETRVSRADAIAGRSFIGIHEGQYRISELNADNAKDAGYILSNSTWAYRQLGAGNQDNFGSGQGLEPVTVTIGAAEDVSFRFDNFYQKLGSLDLSKTFENIPLDRIPDDFYLTVTNDNGDEIGRLTKAQILNDEKIILADQLPPGRYTIQEHNYEIENWRLEAVAFINGAAEVGMPDPIWHFDVPGLIGNSDVTINIVNRYVFTAEPIEPPLPPVYPLQMTKVDQYGNHVAGAEFDLEVFDTSLNGGAGDWRILVKGLQSNSDGLVRYVVTEPGRYRFHETQAPGGYQLPDDPYSEEREVVDGNTDTIYFPNMVNTLTARIQLHKTDVEGEGLAGAVFKVEYRAAETDNWSTYAEGMTTGAGGYLGLNVEKDGYYRFIETQAPDGFVLDSTPREVHVNAGETGDTIFNVDGVVNRPYASIQLRKTDVEGQNLAGAVFKVEFSENKNGPWETVAENLTSGDDGLVKLEDIEKDGYYRFIETVAPAGFVLDSEPRQVHVTAGVGGQVLFSAGDMANRPIASIQLRKIDAEGQNLADAVFKVEFSADGNEPWETIAEALTSGNNGLVKLDVEKDGYYRFVETQAPSGFVTDGSPRQVYVNVGETGETSFDAGTMINHEKEAPISRIQLRKTDEAGQNLAGAIFKVEFSENENGPWETYEEGLSSGTDGLVTTVVEKEGYYRFIETQAPNGFILDSTPRQVKEKVTIGDTGEALFEAENMVNIRNARIQLRKTDEAGQNLAGAVFKVEYSENENGPWETYREDLESKADGLVSTDVDKAGFYRFIETEAPDGFILDSEPRQVPQEVTMGGEEQALFDAGTMENKPVDPETPTPPTHHYAIQLLKVNEQDNPLQGAVFKVETEDGEIVAQNVKSNADGLVTVTVPGPGKYRFVEIQAPSGYKLDKTPQYVTIAEEDGSGVFDAGKLVNKPKPRLPIVGDNLGLWLLTSGLIFLLGAGFVLYKKKKIKI
ncbi:SpaA isopeptide-forming pilin-related protein [Lactococcus petauri]|uniref:SpaA isopeptide-forming pilin-related protein n=1 Tax=Lactococcus petauri TaxID=1940789 RepID=UPI0022DF9B63|nr:SpaA isopeptide-forming pilin-related protein [Lactococcus petauri]